MTVGKEENSSQGGAAGAKRTDWEAIERDYRAGLLSLREIGKVHGISEGMIRKKAKAGNWERDLTERVNEKVRAELVRSDGTQPRDLRTADPRTEREIVETAAATVVQVVRGHRKHISRQIELVDILTEQLVGAAGNRDDIEDAIFDETAGDKDGKRRSAMLKAVALPTQAGAIVNLSNALKTLVGLERQAFSIKDESETQAANPMASLLAQIQGTPLRPQGDE